MAFAVFYNLADLDQLRDQITRQDIPQADRSFAQACWNAGVSGYATAPLAPEEYRCTMTPLGYLCDDDMRIVVVDGKHQGKTILLADFRALLYRLAVAFNTPILSALADDMAGASGAKEPWP